MLNESERYRVTTHGLAVVIMQTLNWTNHSVRYS